MLMTVKMTEANIPRIYQEVRHRAEKQKERERGRVTTPPSRHTHNSAAEA